MNTPDKPSLLIVDDERNFTESLQFAIEDEFMVSVAKDLESARHELRRSVPAAVLLDLRLPDGDGIELLREIRHLNHPPVVVVMTAFATVDTFFAALREGAADYVAKPLHIQTLKNKLRGALDKERRA